MGVWNESKTADGSVKAMNEIKIADTLRIYILFVNLTQPSNYYFPLHSTPVLNTATAVLFTVGQQLYAWLGLTTHIVIILPGTGSPSYRVLQYSVQTKIELSAFFVAPGTIVQ